MAIFTIVLCITIQSVLSAPFADNLVIELPDGQVQGTTYITDNNKTYFGFQGIPYASPPTGSLRFEAPQPPKPWSDVWDATQDSKSCLSHDYVISLDNESEDCLYINVYTPSLKPTYQLPVLFWIYGGGFTTGNSSKGLYGPDYLIEEDVIVVSFNYRLALFGFLSTADTAIRGNAGLKDQNLALKWTYDNIAYFGGDPEKITIFGQSAGGASAGLHLVSKKSAGLFRAAIVESGSALTYWAIDQDARAYAFALAEALSGGTYENDTQKLKEFLQAKSADELITASISLAANGIEWYYHEKEALSIDRMQPPVDLISSKPVYSWLHPINGAGFFFLQQLWPVLEVEDEDAFITESPYELLNSGNFNQVPIIIGICSEESLMFLENLDQAKSIALGLDSFPSQIIPVDLKPNSSDENAVIKEIQNIYIKEGETFSSNLVALAKLYTDNGFSRAVIKHAQLSSNYVPVFLYQFAYYGRPVTQAFIDGAEKAGHSAELPFIFKFGLVNETTDQADVLTQMRMTYYWANFAKFMNPTPPVPEHSKLLNYLAWPTITPTNLQYLNINDTVEVRFNLKNTSFPEWDKIYETYGKRPFITY